MDGHCDSSLIVLKVIHSHDGVFYVELLLSHCLQSALELCHQCKSVILKHCLSPHTLTDLVLLAIVCRV